MMRAVVGIVLGYVIFAGSAVALFQLTRVNPHAPVGAGFMAFTIVYGIVFAAVGGFAAGWIGRRPDTRCGLITAWIIASGATISLIASPAPGAHWSQIAALVLMAPAAWVGDWLRVRRMGTPTAPLLRVRARG